MREKLQKLGKDKRYTFTAAFGRTGYKRTYDSSGNEHYQPTIMFTNVRYNDELVTNHLWFNYTKGFAELQELHVGDTIQFDGRVNGYIKQRTVFDYDIQRPTKIKILKRKSKKNNVIPDPYEDRNALIGYIMHANRDFYLANGRPYDPWYVKQYRNWLANA